jgi:hypothetical protein
MDEAGFIEQFKPAPATTVAEVLGRALVAPDRDEIVQAAAERAAADARAEQRETQMMLNARAGNPLGQVSRYQAVVAECRDRVTDLENQLETERSRLRRATETLAHWSEAAEEVTATARRSAPADLLTPAKQAHAEFAAATRAAFAAVQSGTSRPAPRPFRGGVAVRSHLECVYCLRENVDAETSALLHLDPQHNVPITTAAQAEQAEHAERRGHGSYAEVSR